MKRLLVRSAVSLALAFAALELTLRLVPSLLPQSYLASYPMHGAEFFDPGILARTPIDGVPLPLRHGAYRGAPPADLIELGIAPARADDDARRFPEVSIPVDELGLPNPPATGARDAADVVLIGDSFAVATGVTTPRGLQARLAEQVGSVYNAGVSAIGPVREAWMLEHVGLAKHPRAVVWMYFSGNDASGATVPLDHAREGRDTFAKAHADRMRPALLLPDVVAHLARSRSVGVREREPLPGFVFPLADGAKQPLWFDPSHLGLLQVPVEAWKNGAGFAAACEAIERGAELARAADAKFLLVYLPSKPEVYLPFVERDAELTLHTVAWELPEPPPVDPDEYLDRLLANRHAQETALRDFCDERDIRFLSATPYLEALAASGELGYLVTDTHWQVVGQEALLEPLLAELRAMDVVR